AKEVHLRISSPPTAWPCRYGIDTPNQAELIAFDRSEQVRLSNGARDEATRAELIADPRTVDEVRRFVEADSLAYLSLDGMLRSVSGPRDSYCTACWTGEYRVPMAGEDARQGLLFPIRAEGGE